MALHIVGNADYLRPSTAALDNEYWLSMLQ